MAVLPIVEISQFPQTIDEFVALRDRIAQTPEGGAATLVVALIAYAGDETLGRACLTVAVDRGSLQEGPKGYKGWQLPDNVLKRVGLQIKGKEYLPRSYIRGAAPANGYALPAPPYVIECSDNPYSGDREAGPYKVFVACSGADSPRPVTLKRNDKGFWKASEWSSLIVGIRPPAATPSDDLF